MSDLAASSKVYVAGHQGLVGSALVRHFRKNGFDNLILRSRAELDLTSHDAVWRFFETARPEYVVLAAAKVGGIAANMAAPVEFLVENLEIQNNVLLASQHFQAAKVVFLGSSCIYPREAPQPMREDFFMQGMLEPTNASYAVAKIAGIRLAQSLREQYGLDVICPMPCNVYGPGDHFEYERSHVVSALVRRFVEAKRTRAPSVTLWGTGTARRELMHVDDLADACLFLMRNWCLPDIINVGSGEEMTIRKLAESVATSVGFAGNLVWDITKPDGMPRKLMDVSRLHSLGWRHKIDIESGIQSVIDDFERRHSVRPLEQS
jgi:GDP-L-fucose synthase